MDPQFEEIEFNYVYRRRFLTQIKYILGSVAIITALYFVLRNQVKWIGNIVYRQVPIYILFLSLALAIVFSMIDKESGVIASDLVSTIIENAVGFIWNYVIMALCGSIVGMVFMFIIFFPLLLLLLDFLFIVLFYAACEFLFELIYNLIMLIIEIRVKEFKESVTSVTDKIPMAAAGVLAVWIAVIVLGATWDSLKGDLPSFGHNQ